MFYEGLDGINRPPYNGQNISHEALVNPIRLCGFSKVNMAAVEGSLEEEALRRRERLKAMRIKSGLPEQQVLDTLWTFLFFSNISLLSMN